MDGSGLLKRPCGSELLLSGGCGQLDNANLCWRFLLPHSFPDPPALLNQLHKNQLRLVKLFPIFTTAVVRVLRRNRTRTSGRSVDPSIHPLSVYLSTHHAELAPMSVETKKSCDLPSVSWRPRRAGGIVQPEAETQARAKPTVSAAEDETLSPSSVRELGERAPISPSSAFSSTQALHRLDGAHPHQEGPPALGSPPSKC